jgi:flagellar motor component MotA
MSDPYHGDPWIKRGREHADDGPQRRSQYIAAFRQTRKKARRQGKEEIERQVDEMIDEMIKDGIWSDIDDVEYWDV